jgi:predicted DNA-binding protein with PD1-like motif
MTIHAGIKAIPALSLGCYIRVANVTPSVHLTVLVASSEGHTAGGQLRLGSIHLALKQS